MELGAHQEKVEEFMARHDMDSELEFRILDLVSEVGEVAKDVTKSSDYGLSPEEMEVKKDEIGDVMFSLLAVANGFDISVEDALEAAMEKYERRIEERGDPGSGSR